MATKTYEHSSQQALTRKGLHPGELYQKPFSHLAVVFHRHHDHSPPLGRRLLVHKTDEPRDPLQPVSSSDQSAAVPLPLAISRIYACQRQNKKWLLTRISIPRKDLRFPRCG